MPESRERNEERKDIKVKCPSCNHIEELKDLSGWSFVILKRTKCKKCGAVINHEDMIN